ncbi:SMI1/KNR4 family protein [Endozoicomonas sp. SM1973]|uniref:SMI1/KNR4 family protein n=1 Tax=Spartinivicinus marinus TaxID=2994442 RepID=A0A853IPR9_9GAMM|nr:SMI1/KNR4 family protein [Spartinivicinus marinus]MCX4028073.1 SMI1/KNR4 family protein [Spartinivicinus marinus]NYZ69896.1 SMI1/KNR4 family protein [Spartinivicinus marinus]
MSNISIISTHYETIKKWMKVNFPERLAGLNGPASSETIAKLKAYFPDIPEDFLASLAVHNGESEDKGGGEDEDRYLLPGISIMLSVDEIISYYELKKEWHADAQDDEDGFYDEEDEYDLLFSALYYHPDWIPIAKDIYTVKGFTYIDMAPGPKGTKGQIIDVCESDTVVLAPSWSDFLKSYGEDLESGEYYINEESGIIFEKDEYDDEGELENEDELNLSEKEIKSVAISESIIFRGLGRITEKINSFIRELPEAEKLVSLVQGYNIPDDGPLTKKEKKEETKFRQKKEIVDIDSQLIQNGFDEVGIMRLNNGCIDMQFIVTVFYNVELQLYAQWWHTSDTALYGLSFINFNNPEGCISIEWNNTGSSFEDVRGINNRCEVLSKCNLQKMIEKANIFEKQKTVKPQQYIEYYGKANLQRAKAYIEQPVENLLAFSGLDISHKGRVLMFINSIKQPHAQVIDSFIKQLEILKLGLVKFE